MAWKLTIYGTQFSVSPVLGLCKGIAILDIRLAGWVLRECEIESATKVNMRVKNGEPHFPNILPANLASNVAVHKLKREKQNYAP